MQLKLGYLFGMCSNLCLQGMTQAQLVKLLFVFFLGCKPGGDIILRLQRYVQTGSQRLPLFSKCLLLLRKRLYLAFIAL